MGGVAVAGDDRDNALNPCVVSSVLDGSLAFVCAVPGVSESPKPLSAGDCASCIILLEGNENISRGVDEAGRSDCG